MSCVQVGKRSSLAVKLFAFMWRFPIARIGLRLANLDYNKFMMKVLNTNQNYDESIRYELERRFWFGTMNLDLAKPTQRSIFFEKEYEPRVVHLLRKHLLPGYTFVDVGAHVGYFSLMASNLVGPSGRVLSFEPDAANYERLRQHVVRNEKQNIAVLKLALSDKSGEMKFLINPFNDGGHSLESFPGYQALRAENVRTATLDDVLVNRFPGLPIHLLKIDVEGHQLHVLKGMRRTLQAYSPKLIVEIGSNERGEKATFEFLATEGYRGRKVDRYNYFFSCDTSTL